MARVGRSSSPLCIVLGSPNADLILALDDPRQLPMVVQPGFSDHPRGSRAVDASVPGSLLIHASCSPFASGRGDTVTAQIFSDSGPVITQTAKANQVSILYQSPRIRKSGSCSNSIPLQNFVGQTYNHQLDITYGPSGKASRQAL
jgi:hypothetical protein